MKGNDLFKLAKLRAKKEGWPDKKSPQSKEAKVKPANRKLFGIRCCNKTELPNWESGRWTGPSGDLGAGYGLEDENVAWKLPNSIEFGRKSGSNCVVLLVDVPMAMGIRYNLGQKSETLQVIGSVKTVHSRFVISVDIEHLSSNEAAELIVLAQEMWIE